MGLPTIPDPKQVPSVVIYEACNSVVEWARTCDDIEQVQDAKDKMAAIAVYLQGKDAAAAAAAATRRLELRIGQLMPEPQQGSRTDLSPASERLPIPRMDASRFRKMAALPEVVEQVIADSDDKNPPSRKKVLDAIQAGINADVASIGPSPNAEFMRQFRKLGFDQLLRMAKRDEDFCLTPQEREDCIDLIKLYRNQLDLVEMAIYSSANNWDMGELES